MTKLNFFREPLSSNDVGYFEGHASCASISDFPLSTPTRFNHEDFVLTQEDDSAFHHGSSKNTTNSKLVKKSKGGKIMLPEAFQTRLKKFSPRPRGKSVIGEN